MSSLPGLELEDYVAWNHDLIVQGRDDANASLAIADALGRPSGRLVLTQEEFAPIVERYEPHRERVEYYLGEFDYDTQNWRDYAFASFGWIPESVTTEVMSMIQDIRSAQYSPPPTASLLL